MDAIRLSCEGIPVDDYIGLVGNGLDIRHKLNVHFLSVSGRRWHQCIVLRGHDKGLVRVICASLVRSEK